MKKTVMLLLAMFILMTSAFIPACAQLQLIPPGLKWDERYNFDICNVFKIEFYAKNNELMSTAQYKTYYQSDGQNFLVKLDTDKKGGGMETVIDKKNEVAVQVFGSGGGATPYYNVGGYKYPTEKELKKLDLVPTTETKRILGFTCKKYTYTYKKIFGEVWLTDQIDLPNDLGVFRACKMAALHNTLSAAGFVMEMTTEDDKGGKTLMTTIALKKAEKYSLDLKGVEMNTAINKVNYFKF